MAFEVHPEPTLDQLRQELAHAREQLKKQSVPPPTLGWEDVIDDLEKEIKRRTNGQ